MKTIEIGGNMIKGVATWNKKSEVPKHLLSENVWIWSKLGFRFSYLPALVRMDYSAPEQHERVSVLMEDGTTLPLIRDGEGRNEWSVDHIRIAIEALPHHLQPRP